MKCTVCNGTGRTSIRYEVYTPNEPIEVKCEYCNGTGKDPKIKFGISKTIQVPGIEIDGYIYELSLLEDLAEVEDGFSAIIINNYYVVERLLGDNLAYATTKGSYVGTERLKAIINEYNKL